MTLDRQQHCEVVGVLLLREDIAPASVQNTCDLQRCRGMLSTQQALQAMVARNADGHLCCIDHCAGDH